MRILALETSGSAGSVAVLEDNRLILQQTLRSDRRSAQSLVPGVDALLAAAGWSIGGVDLVAVTQGPGSFTGLRIGITTAKALAYAVGAEVIGVNTLEVIARQARRGAETAALWAVLDAQRGELFAARFAGSNDEKGSERIEVQTIGRDAWLEQLTPGDFVTGPGLERFATGLPANVTAVQPELWNPQAATVGQIGHEQHSAGRRDELFQLSPRYFRRAAAEEQWERRQKPTA